MRDLEPGLLRAVWLLAGQLAGRRLGALDLGGLAVLAYGQVRFRFGFYMYFKFPNIFLILVKVHTCI